MQNIIIIVIYQRFSWDEPVEVCYYDSQLIIQYSSQWDDVNIMNEEEWIVFSTLADPTGLQVITFILFLFSLHVYSYFSKLNARETESRMESGSLLLELLRI